MEPLVPMENAPDWVARRVVAERRYEISNHLGNVLVTVLDRKTTTTTTPITATTNVTTNTLILATAAHLFRADIATATDYYAFGQPMPTRDYKAAWSSTEYRYGMNTQEESPEIQAFHTTALYWEYDSRIGRRWNVDPVVKPWESPYMCFGDNPIMGSDVLGNTTNDWVEKDGKITWKDNVTSANDKDLKKGEIYRGKSYAREETGNSRFSVETGL